MAERDKLLNSEKKFSLWCVAKSADVLDRNGKKIDSIPFRKQVWIMRSSEKWVSVLYVGEDGQKHSGWVCKAALANHPVHDYARLYYENSTGKKIPIAKRYGGKAETFAGPGTRFQVIARCGGWFLTEQGWTLVKFLRRCEGDFLDVNAKSLLTAIMTEAGKEYISAVKRIKHGKCHSAEEYGKAFGRIDEITRWFKSHEFGLLYEGDGKEKLEWLNENLGVDAKWLKDKRRIYEELKARGVIT